MYPAEKGAMMIDLFLGDYFIYKCMWSTPATIKSTAASIKKFYKSMMDHGNLDKEDYKNLCEEIKEEMEMWQTECEMVNNGGDIFALLDLF